MTDARFEEVPATHRPLRLKAESESDLAVISSLVQDAVGKVAEIHWARNFRRLVLLLNRFRWEDKPAADRENRPYERVQSALTFETVTRVRSAGVDPTDGGAVYDVLAIAFAPAGDDCGGTLTLTLAGEGALAAEVEALQVTLADVTRPWAAQATRAPDHGV